eukprot:1563621-Pleurochrysis_carterae.AAC.5
MSCAACGLKRDSRQPSFASVFECVHACVRGSELVRTKQQASSIREASPSHVSPSSTPRGGV